MKRLVFDIGAYTGDDLETFLQDGCSVVAVEANPIMAANLRKKFKDRDCEVVEKALSDLQQAEFFVSNEHPDWSSLSPQIAGRLTEPTKVIVETVTINQLFAKYGVPTYLKVDIEGADIVLLNQLKRESTLPPYISCETECVGKNGFRENNHFEVLNALQELGYTKFKLANGYDRCPKGFTTNLPWEFDHLIKWNSYEQVHSQIESIVNNYQGVPWGIWYDVYAKL